MRQRLSKFLELFFRRKRAENKQIRRFFESESVFFNAAAYDILYVDTAVEELPVALNELVSFTDMALYF